MRWVSQPSCRVLAQVLAGTSAVALLCGCQQQRVAGQGDPKARQVEPIIDPDTRLAEQGEQAAAPAERMAAQVEAFGVDGASRLVRLSSQSNPQRSPATAPSDGDAIRLSDDVVTFEVASVFLQALPPHVRGSGDVIVFADVWENAAAGYTTPSLTSIVYLGKNQQVPGRLNFRDALFHGPTQLKGQPLRVRFTIVVLQTGPSEGGASAVDIIGAFAGGVASERTPITPSTAKALQGIVSAQPGGLVFDYEMTLFSDRPEASPTTAASRPRADAGERPPWLKYGQFVLLETGSLPAGERSKLTLSDGWLRHPATAPAVEGRSVAANYLVIRVRPHQSSKGN